MDTNQFREQPTVRIRPPRELLQNDRDRRDEPCDEPVPETEEEPEDELLHRPPTLNRREVL